MATDDRNYLFEYMVGAALELKPRLFLMENVPGMKSPQRGRESFLERAEAILVSKGGYQTAIWKLNAAAFGVPQERLRYFLVAARGRSLPAFPEVDYQASQQDEVPLDALPPVSLDEAIFDLPERHADSGAAVARWTSDRATTDKRSRRYLSKFRILDKAALLYNHTVRYHNPLDLQLYGLLRQGEDGALFLERLQRTDLMRYRSDVFDDKYARLTGRNPCKTIVAHLAKDGNGYVHPTQPRSITVREGRAGYSHSTIDTCSAELRVISGGSLEMPFHLCWPRPSRGPSRGSWRAEVLGEEQPVRFSCVSPPGPAHETNRGRADQQ